jgi:adenylyltransferase/sulfurtransferase
MRQETSVRNEVHDRHIMPSVPSEHNGVSTARHIPGDTQAGSLPDLTTEELVRYDRHLLLPQVGAEGQGKLKAASVLLDDGYTHGLNPARQETSGPAPVL